MRHQPGHLKKVSFVENQRKMEGGMVQYDEETSMSQEIQTRDLLATQREISRTEDEFIFYSERLQEIVDRFQILISNFVIHDISTKDCPVIYYSDGFKDLTGLQHNEIIGKNIFLRCKNIEGIEIGNMLCNSMLERVPASAIIEGYTKSDGTTFDNFVHTYPLNSGSERSIVISQHVNFNSVLKHFAHCERPVSITQSEKSEVLEEVDNLIDPPLFQSYLEWKNVTLVVDAEAKSKLPFKKKTKKITLIKDVSGFAMPGDMIVIMGPSGCGKTTLLNILAKRKEIGVSGEILFNGLKRDNNYVRRVGYVLQDDILFPVLTVYQTLLVQARLRLPREMSLKKKEEMVEKVIKALGLEKARNTIIGNQFLRGISGGERKRVNIGCQLLSYSSIIFFDEPTSGLDTSTALSLTKMMKGLAETGYTIISTMHQPSAQMYSLFDKLMMMMDGHVIYFGPANKASEYFSSVGYEVPLNVNAADYIMGLSLDEEKRGTTDTKKRLIELWAASSLAQVSPNPEFAESIQKKANSITLRKYPASYFEQAYVLGSRSLRMNVGAYFQPLPLFQTVFVAVLVGLIWLQTPADMITNRSGIIFFTVLFAGGFTPLLNVLYSFPLERPVILRERSEGAYPLSAYFLSKTIGEAPFELIYPFLFLVISYWMVGYNPAFTHFLLFFVVLMFLTWSSSGLGLAIGSCVYNVKAASTLATIIILSLVLTAGFYVSIAQIPVWIRWLQYLSFIKYSYDALIMTELTGVDLSSFNIILASYGGVLGLLIAFIVGFRVIAFILLKIFFKQKK